MQADVHAVKVTNHPVTVEHRDDGTLLVKSTGTLGPYEKRVTDRLAYWAQQAPERAFLAQRSRDGHWEKLSYAQTLAQVQAVAQYLLEQNLSAERPVVILSGNSSEHLIMGMAAMYIGVPYAPISQAYSLVDKSFGKLDHVMKTLTPGLIFVDNLGPYREAIDAVAPKGCPVVATEVEHALDEIAYPVTPFSTLLKTRTTAALAQANAAVQGDTIAKFLFTSGSTGSPKAVINTHRMLCANQQMLRSVLAFLEDEPPVLVDWLPWSHTFGGNHNAGIALYNGGTFYIDQGKPVGKDVDITLRNLQDVSPTLYFNVPKGYEVLVRKLQQRPEVAERFFARLKIMYYAAAGLSQHVWDQLDELAVRYTGKKIPMLSGLGSTETAPAALFASGEECASGVIGLPAPGVEIKLVPNAGKLEARLRAVTITPGYWRNPELTAKAFDEEGFYCLGDAFKFIDPEHPNRGFLFDGRVSEDFKLDTGTWVSVGGLRSQLIHHFAPYIQDVVITGRDRGFIGALVFPDLAQCRQLLEHERGLDDAQVLSDPQVLAIFSQGLQTLAARNTGSSTLVRRIQLQIEPPEFSKHEVTDKGSINQNAVMENRSDAIEDLYSDVPSARVISVMR
jgi:feruloyl-CoA synthase